MNMSDEVIVAMLRGAVVGGLGAVLWLLMATWLGRRWEAKRTAASRKIKDRLGR